MSDLAATNCGCGNDCGGMSSCMWIIILCLLSSNGCNGSSPFNSNGCGGSDSCIWIILLLLFCGGGNGIGLNNGCGNGCGCGC